VRFKRYLLTEITLTVDQALGLLGLTASDLGDMNKIKTTFRDMSKKHHPDQGGTKEQQQQLNAAWELLKRGGKAAKKTDVRFEEKWKQTGLSMKTMMLHAFDPATFIRHFNKYTNEKLFSKMTNIRPQEKDKRPYSAGFTTEFFNKDRSIVFELYTSAEISRAFREDTLGFGDIQFPISMQAYGFFSGKKQKLAQRDWKFTSDHSFFKEPEKVFPDKKLKAIFSGKTSARKYQRRDMTTYIEKRLKGDVGNQYTTIPLIDDYKLVLFRSVFQRQAAWMFNGLYKGHKRIDMLVTVTMPESEETGLFLFDLQKEIKRKKPVGDDKMIKAVNKILQRYKDTRK